MRRKGNARGKAIFCGLILGMLTAGGCDDTAVLSDSVGGNSFSVLFGGSGTPASLGFIAATPSGLGIPTTRAASINGRGLGSLGFRRNSSVTIAVNTSGLTTPPAVNTIPLHSTAILSGLNVGMNDPFFNAPLGIPTAGLSNPMQPPTPNPLVSGF